MQANTNEVEALRLVNQRLIGELEQLTRQIQRPRDTRQAQEGHNFSPHEGQHNLDIPRGAETEEESSRARGHGPHLALGGEGNEATLGEHVGNGELHEGHNPRSLAAHFDGFIYSAQVTLPEESDQLKLHRHSATSPLGWNATKATVPGAQQLTLTSSSTLHKSRYLRSQTSSGYIATRLERYQGHNARSPAAHFDEFVYSAQVTLPEESDQIRLHRHSATLPLGWNATKATTPRAQQLSLTSSSTLHRSCYLRSQNSSGYIATRLHRHSAGTPPRPQRPKPSSSL